jgi:hypothetical protein
MMDPNMKKGTWTLNKDERLTEAVSRYGGSWSKVQEAIPGQTANRCRERYVRGLGLGIPPRTEGKEG